MWEWESSELYCKIPDIIIIIIIITSNGDIQPSTVVSGQWLYES